MLTTAQAAEIADIDKRTLMRRIGRLLKPANAKFVKGKDYEETVGGYLLSEQWLRGWRASEDVKFRERKRKEAKAAAGVARAEIEEDI